MTEKEKEESKKEEAKMPTVVVAQLPQIASDIAADKNGKEYKLVTVEEALTEILETIRQLKKGLL